MLNSNFSSLHFHSTILLETNHHLLTCLSRKALTLLYSWQPFLLLFSLLHGEGDGTPLQYSCLENPMDGGAWWASVHGVAKSRTRLSDFPFTFSLSCIGEGSGTPLQCSCLENPRDGGAWWAAVYGVTQSQTQLKRLSSSSRHIHITIYKIGN